MGEAGAIVLDIGPGPSCRLCGAAATVQVLSVTIRGRAPHAADDRGLTFMRPVYLCGECYRSRVDELLSRVAPPMGDGETASIVAMGIA